jgi:hypothetical protein
MSRDGSLAKDYYIVADVVVVVVVDAPTVVVVDDNDNVLEALAQKMIEEEAQDLDRVFNMYFSISPSPFLPLFDCLSLFL